MEVLSNENNFTYLNEKGEKITCDILCNLETKNKNYIIYTNNKYKDGNKKIYANYYFSDGDKRKLEPIETEEEWKMIEAILTYLTK